MFDSLVVQFENTVEYADLVVSKRLLALAVESEEGLELCLFVCMGLVTPENPIEELGYRPCDGSFGPVRTMFDNMDR